MTDLHTSFYERMQFANGLEQAVADQFDAAGLTVDRFDRSRFSAHMERAISRAPSVLRHLPDLIVVGVDSGAALIDCKNGRSDTAFYSIQIASHEAMRVWAQVGLPTWYVMHDQRLITPAEIECAGYEVRDGSGTNGSGTPFLLARKTDFDDRWLHDHACRVTDDAFYAKCATHYVALRLFDAS